MSAADSVCGTQIIIVWILLSGFCGSAHGMSCRKNYFRQRGVAEYRLLYVGERPARSDEVTALLGEQSSLSTHYMRSKQFFGLRIKQKFAKTIRLSSGKCLSGRNETEPK